jgi:hypothetical protein
MIAGLIGKKLEWFRAAANATSGRPFSLNAGIP